MHLANINTLHQSSISCIEVETEDRTSPTKRAQSSRAALGTCRNVGSHTRRISSMDGRVHTGATFRESSVEREGRPTWELLVAAWLLDRTVELWPRRDGSAGSRAGR